MQLNLETWNNQLKFNEQYFKDNGLDLYNLDSQKTFWIKEFVLHIEQELHDIIQCFPNWKMNNISDKTKIEVSENYKEEFIDTFKYLLGLAQIMGLSYDDIINEYNKKSFVVEQKYNQNKTFEQLKNKEVIVFDIDGIINYYPQCFVDYVNREFEKNYCNIKQMKVESIEKYNEYKHLYRTSGEKRILKINEDTVQTINKLYENYNVVLYTVRPVNKYKNIYYDTIEWLKNNDVHYHAIFWSDYSKEDFNKLGLKIKCFIDDTFENSILFANERYKSFLLNTVDNLTKNEENSNLIRINKVSEILELI